MSRPLRFPGLVFFRAALLIGISQISIYIGFETRAGLYYFALGVLLNNAATMRLTFTRFK